MVWIDYFRSHHSVSHWFLKHRAAALGVVTAGSSVGGVVWPIAIRHLINKVGANLVGNYCWFSQIINSRLVLDGPFGSAASLLSS